MSVHRSARLLEATTLALFVAALVWWAIVYAQVSYATGFGLSNSLACMVYTSDRCSLAMALCKSWHFLGIKRYHAEAFWVSGLLAVLALTLSHYAARRGGS